MSLSKTKLEYADFVRTLANDKSSSVRAFAMYHAGEIDIELSSPPDPDAAPRASTKASLRDIALDMIEQLPDALARRAPFANRSAET